MTIKRLFKSLTIDVLFICVMVAASHAYGAKKHVTIAIFPCTDEVMAFKRFGPLVTYLKQETGFDFSLVVPTDPAEFEMGLKNKDIDFAFQNVRTYVRFAGLYDNGTLLRAVTRKGTITRSGVVIAKESSGIKKVADLRGKVVLFGPKHSTTRWVEAKVLFEESGLNIDKDLKAYSHGRSCDGIAFSVQFGGVDAGVICDHFFEQHSDRQQQIGVDPKQFTVIGRTKLVSTRVFAPRRDVGSDIVNAVNQALLRLDHKMPAHHKTLHTSELGGFQKSKDEDYNDTRMQMGGKMRE
jgi:phosphonate transport system substrate-binding protein